MMYLIFDEEFDLVIFHWMSVILASNVILTKGRLEMIMISLTLGSGSFD